MASQLRSLNALHAEAPLTEELFAEGYCVVPALVPPERIGRVAHDLATDFADTPFCTGDFYGHRTKRFGRLLSRSPCMASLVAHPTILRMADAVLRPWCDTVQLNLTQATAIHPGAPAQFPHRDQDMWAGDIGVREYLLNVIWPLDRFTHDNGATVIWPHSHGTAALGASDPPDSPPVTVECEPGDAIVFLGSTLHGAGENRSDHVRRGLIISYCLGWLKPYENQWLAYPPEVARHFAPDLAGLVGYRQHRPNLGNFEGQCPSVLLGDHVPARLGAIDALRPDQAEQLAAHMAMRSAPGGDGA